MTTIDPCIIEHDPDLGPGEHLSQFGREIRRYHADGTCTAFFAPPVAWGDDWAWSITHDGKVRFTTSRKAQA